MQGAVSLRRHRHRRRKPHPLAIRSPANRERPIRISLRNRAGRHLCLEFSPVRLRGRDYNHSSNSSSRHRNNNNYDFLGSFVPKAN